MRSAPSRPPLAYGAVGLVVVAAYLTADSGVAGAVLYVGIAFSSAAAIVLGTSLHRPRPQLPWLLVALGVALLAGGELTWEIYEHALDQYPFPSAADALYLAGYPCISAGLIILARSRAGSRAHARGSVVDAAIVTVAASVLAWAVLVEPYARDASLPLAERLLSPAYPLMDLLLLTLLVRLLFTPGTRSPAFWLLAAGIVCNIAADTAFAVLELSSLSGDIAVLNATWLVGYLFLGAGALHPSMVSLGKTSPRHETGLTRFRLAALGVAALTAPTVLAVEAARGDVAHPVAIVGAAVLPLLALARLVGVVRELERVGGQRERLFASERAARAESEVTQRLLRQQNDRLRELDRLKDEFVALVSHELRTPLTSITGYLELVQEDEALSDEGQRFLEVVDRNSKRLLRLVSDLLFVAQIEAGRLALELGEVRIQTIAEESVEALRPVAEAASVELRLNSAPLPALRGDPARLGQLLDNLVSNAVKFTPPGGRVVVALGASGDDVVLAVSDTGIGVSPAEQRRLFDRFFRASAAQERAIEGTGLGLTIARAIVDAHGGSIGFTSVEGEGTTFRVRLPLAGPTAEGAAAPEAAPRASSRATD